MATEKQILANRKNARSSTGPRTVPGKTRSRMNARRHGLAALLEGMFSETCLGVEALSDRLSQIEAERLRLHQEIGQSLKKGEVEKVTMGLCRLSALDRYALRCSSALRKR
jgi:hypothetical protein